VHPILEQLGISQREIMLLNPAEQEDLLRLVDEYDNKIEIEKCRTSFWAFAKRLWPVVEGAGFVEGKHHRRLADILDQVAEGKLKRVTVSLPPRHTKSALVSKLFPAYFIGRNASTFIIQACNIKGLADQFGGAVRTLVMSPEYQEIFPETKLDPSSTAKGDWATTKSGKYYAVGVGGTATGRGANLGIVDDPHDEREAVIGLVRPEIYDVTYEWYKASIRQRLQPGGALIIVACVAEGERVLLADGTWRAIQDVKVGDFVAGAKGLTTSKGKVTAVIDQGPDDLIEVVSRSSSLKVNKRHPFLVVKGGLKKSPRNQEEVLSAKEWTLEWVRAGDLKPGDTVVTVKNLSVGNGHRPARYKSSKQFTFQDYWLFGFMFGDGWLVNAGARGITGFCIAKSEYPKLNEYFIEAATSMFGTPPTEKQPEGYYRWDNMLAGRWLAKKGFSSGAKTKRVPEWVFRLRPVDKRAFLQGFFEADGYAQKAKGSRPRKDTWVVGLANKELLDDLRLLARTCGVRTSKIYESMQVAKPPNTKEAREFTSYKARFTFCENKLELRSRYSGQNAYGVRDNGVRLGNGAQQFRFEDIDEIRSAGRAKVYDLTVDTQENFIAEGFVVHNTRWSKRDLIGRILADDKDGEWTVVEMPAILPSGNPLWPEYWSLEELNKVKENIGMMRWNAQYMQQPTSVEQAMVKPSDWIPWTEPGETKPPPRCSFIVQSWDTAHSAKKHANPSACTTWGVTEVENRPALVLLHAWQDRVEFPELKLRAKELYKEWKPDYVIIESQASGRPLMAEMRVAGVPVVEFKAQSGVDKITRVNAVTDLFKAGFIRYVPSSDTNQVISQLAEFPAGSADDLVDSTTAALDLLKRQINDYRRKEATEDDDEDTELVRTRLRRKFY